MDTNPTNPHAQSWMSDPTRHCEGVPTSTFFIGRGDTEQSDRAKAICAGTSWLGPSGIRSVSFAPLSSSGSRAPCMCARCVSAAMPG
jgi:hypothetical protein